MKVRTLDPAGEDHYIRFDPKNNENLPYIIVSKDNVFTPLRIEGRTRFAMPNEAKHSLRRELENG